LIIALINVNFLTLIFAFYYIKECFGFKKFNLKYLRIKGGSFCSVNMEQFGSGDFFGHLL
jgi:hypothetical protein